jgi:hypothetical protein
MDHRDTLDQISSSYSFPDYEICSTRRGLLFAPLLVALPLALSQTEALAGEIVARSPHYDGVKKNANEPAIIGLFGIAPVQFELVDPGKPGWRKL